MTTTKYSRADAVEQPTAGQAKQPADQRAPEVDPGKLSLVSSAGKSGIKRSVISARPCVRPGSVAAITSAAANTTAVALRLSSACSGTRVGLAHRKYTPVFPYSAYFFTSHSWNWR